MAQCPEMAQIEVGLAHFLLQHTSASLSVNENADSSVRRDMERHFNELAPENAPYYEHTYEGPDDMPAHIKAALTATTLSIPFQDRQLLLGTWQGIYLWEHRHGPQQRQIAVHIGE